MLGFHFVFNWFFFWFFVSFRFFGFIYLLLVAVAATIATADDTYKYCYDLFPFSLYSSFHLSAKHVACICGWIKIIWVMWIVLISVKVDIIQPWANTFGNVCYWWLYCHLQQNCTWYSPNQYVCYEREREKYHILIRTKQYFEFTYINIGVSKYMRVCVCVIFGTGEQYM